MPSLCSSLKMHTHKKNISTSAYLFLFFSSYALSLWNSLRKAMHLFIHVFLYFVIMFLSIHCYTLNSDDQLLEPVELT